MQQAQQAVVGQIRLLGRAAGARAASSAASPSARAAVTLPNGKQLELADGDIKLTMPAEWHPHTGCWMAWPKRPDVWRDGCGPAIKAFVEVIKAISQFEPVTVIADPTIVRGRMRRMRGRACAQPCPHALRVVPAACVRAPAAPASRCPGCGSYPTGMQTGGSLAAATPTCSGTDF
jgi:hypothetical protein